MDRQARSSSPPSRARSARQPNPICSATTASGRPCRARAQAGSRFCRAHDPDKRPESGPPHGNKNALKHGAYAHWTAPDDRPDPDIRKVARNLDYAGEQMLKLLEDNGHDIQTIVKVVNAVGQNASRIARLLRDQRAVSGQAADGIADAFARILDEITGEAGRE